LAMTNELIFLFRFFKT